MANERQRRLMQEAVDKTLPQETLHEFYQQLDRSPRDSAEFQRLRQVDRMLRTAPMERAPQGLALNIMARLMEGLQPDHLRTSGLALAIGLALVTLFLMPLLGVIGWMLVNAVGSASALTVLIQQIIRVLGIVMTSLGTLVQGAQDILLNYPVAPVLMVSLIPIAAFWLLRFTLKHRALDVDGSAA